MLCCGEGEEGEEVWGNRRGGEEEYTSMCTCTCVCVTFYIKESALQLSATAIVCTFDSFEINFMFSNSVAIIGAIVYLILLDIAQNKYCSRPTPPGT